MSKFRYNAREKYTTLSASDHIIVIEDSQALGTLLKMRLQAETQATIHWCTTYKAAEALIMQQKITLAVTGLNLPDAPNGEMVDLLAVYEIPTILFTATFDKNIRSRYANCRLVDYFIKDGVETVDMVIKSIIRTIENATVSILVVDDVDSTRSLLTNFLDQQNFQVIEATSGAEALAILSGSPDVQLVITDYHMPDMDGHELTKHIRQLYSLDDLRIIGVSSSSDSYLSAAFLKAGASDFIYRPFIAEEMQCRINNNIDALKQIKQLRYLAERDFLSKLYNRRAFFDQAQVILARLAQDDERAAVAILDVDHFKNVNDQYGHNAGDLVIKAVAAMLTDFSKQHNFLTARLGGEEFCLLFENMHDDAIMQLCDKIRETIAKHSVEHEDSLIKITASLGVARVYHGEPLDNHLNAADQMLYMAKEAGRNRVQSDFVFG